MSLVLYGPPGTGKTTLAHVISLATKRKFVQLSALDAGVKEVRAVIAGAKNELVHGNRRTVLFIDEVHRFSKTQQDSLLSAVEDRVVSLIAATTENPFFSVVSPLLSRSLVLALQSLSDDDVRAVLHRALTSERGLAGAVTLTEEAEEHLVRVAGGDARKALTALESGAGAAAAAGTGTLDLATLETAVAQAAVRYDRAGDQHYDIASALIKSIRGSDVDAAMHYLARMVEAGEDPRFIARRLVISASEDIGLADPTALPVAVAAAEAVAFIGMPEGHFALAQATAHLATAPKSNALTVAISESVADVRAGLGGPVPPGLRDAHYAGAKKLGHGATYAYPHDHPTASWPSSTRPTPSSAATTTGPPAGARRPRSGPGWPSCARSSAAVAERRRPVSDPAVRVAPTWRQPGRSCAQTSKGSHHVSAGEIAGLIAAGALVLLVVLLAVPLLKLGRTLDETTLTIRQVREQSQPILSQASTTVTHVNANLERVDDITGNAANVSSNVAALTSVFAATLGSPLIKAAAFSYGVRSAVGKKREGQALATAQRDQKAERRARRAARRAA